MVRNHRLQMTLAAAQLGGVGFVADPKATALRAAMQALDRAAIAKMAEATEHMREAVKLQKQLERAEAKGRTA